MAVSAPQLPPPLPQIEESKSGSSLDEFEDFPVEGVFERGGTGGGFLDGWFNWLICVLS